MTSHGLTVYVSGLYSGANPQPGLGVARSLRQGFPDAEIVGVEYSNRCSGIHWLDLDRIQLYRPWEELSLSAHAQDVRGVLDDGSFWISCIDLEVLWLAEAFADGHHPRLLTPPLAALQNVGKPAIPVHKYLPVKIPSFIDTDHSDWELHAFCRKHDWKVWLKGPYYEAVRISTWSDLEHWRNILSRAWNTEKLFLQAHVTGYEESIMICAYQGDIADAVYMRKRDLTDLGKTWAGDSSPVPDEILSPLREIVRDLKWTGGAEFEMVRDAADVLWLLEINPRFPAWVHGSTLTGSNLPAGLLEAASGITAEPVPAQAEEFTRVVIEIPVRAEFPLPPLPEPFDGDIGHSMKHPSGLIEFAQSLEKPFEALNGNGHGGANGNGNGNFGSKTSDLDVPQTFVNDLDGFDFEEIQTPTYLFLEQTAAAYFKRAAEFADANSLPGVEIKNAYSIKTNPDERLTRLALENGFLAETITLLEARKAIDAGFSGKQLILNGPGKWWRRETIPDLRAYAVYCDSIEEVGRVADELENGSLQADIFGVRLRVPGIASRFGVSVGSPDDLERLVVETEKIPANASFGIHFHIASSSVGLRAWWHLFKSMLKWCKSIQGLSGRAIEVLDIGGGWFPDDLSNGQACKFREAVRKVPEFLPSVGRIIMEPGKAVAQPSMALATRILEIRHSKGKASEAVVDASVADLPMHFFQPHRILVREDGVWRPCGRGKGRLLGRLCMEQDILAANIDLPKHTREGDVLIFCDSGAYDRSMSYVFGCG